MPVCRLLAGQRVKDPTALSSKGLSSEILLFLFISIWPPQTPIAIYCPPGAHFGRSDWNIVETCRCFHLLSKGLVDPLMPSIVMAWLSFQAETVECASPKGLGVAPMVIWWEILQDWTIETIWSEMISSKLILDSDPLSFARSLGPHCRVPSLRGQGLVGWTRRWGI